MQGESFPKALVFLAFQLPWPLLCPTRRSLLRALQRRSRRSVLPVGCEEGQGHGEEVAVVWVRGAEPLKVGLCSAQAVPCSFWVTTQTKGVDLKSL